MEFETNARKIEEYKAAFTKYNQRRKRFFRAYFKLWHRYEVIGLENLPEGAALIAVNHSGGWDLDIVSLKDCTHPTRDIHPLIVQNWHFLNSAWGRYWIGGGIPLWTRSGIRYEYIDPYLDKNGAYYPALVAIYPEGHSSTFKKRHVLNKFFPGVVRIALRYRVPIVPVALIGFHYITPILGEIKRDHAPNDPIFPPILLPVKLKVEIGAPFELEEYYGKTLSKEEEFWVANEMVRPRIAQLLGKHGNIILEKVDVEMKKP